MKKIVIILSVFALIASGCGHATKKQTTNENSSVCQQDTLIELSETHGILFLRYDKEMELWYEPHIVNLNKKDTLKINGYYNENGSYPDEIDLSPNLKYMVLHHLFGEGYVEMDDGQKLYQNWKCSIIDIENAKVVETMQSDCSGKWDKNNNWVSGDEIIFSSTETTKDEELSEMDVEELFTYRGLTLGEAYPKFLKDKPEIGKHLPKELTSDDKTYTSNVDNENVEITYRPLVDEDGLAIELFYQGGVTTVKFECGGNGIRVRIIYSAD